MLLCNNHKRNDGWKLKDVRPMVLGFSPPYSFVFSSLIMEEYSSDVEDFRTLMEACLHQSRKTSAQEKIMKKIDDSPKVQCPLTLTEEKP